MREEIEQIKQMAKEIRQMEKSYDYSMRGVFLDHFVTNYCEEFGEDFRIMYEYIMENQKEDYDSYGDADTSVTKIKVKGEIGNYTDHDYSASAIFLNDIFSDNKFIIVKTVCSPKEELIRDNMTQIEYHVRKVQKEIEKSITFKDYVRYGDIRDNGYVVSFKVGYFNRPIQIIDTGMSGHYTEFNQLIFAIQQPYNELKETENG